MSARRPDAATERAADEALERRLTQVLAPHRLDARALRRGVARRTAGRAAAVLVLGGAWFAAERLRVPEAEAPAPAAVEREPAPVAVRRPAPATPRPRAGERDEAAPLEAPDSGAAPELDPDAGKGMR